MQHLTYVVSMSLSNYHMKRLGLGRLCSIFFTNSAILICSKFYQLCLKVCCKFAYDCSEYAYYFRKEQICCSNNYFTLY